MHTTRYVILISVQWPTNRQETKHFTNTLIEGLNRKQSFTVLARLVFIMTCNDIYLITLFDCNKGDFISVYLFLKQMKWNPKRVHRFAFYKQHHCVDLLTKYVVNTPENLPEFSMICKRYIPCILRLFNKLLIINHVPTPSA